jgi:TRAP transporter TAXI family solute receptor
LKKTLAILLVTLLVAAVLALPACAPAATTPTKPATSAAPAPAPTTAAPAPAPAPAAFKWPSSITIVATGTGGAGHTTATAWSTPFSKDTGVAFRITGEDSQMRRFQMIKQGQVLMGGEEPPIDMMEGTSGFAIKDGGPFPARTVYPISRADSGYATAKDSPIKTPKDIKPGTRIIYMTFAPVGRNVMESLLAWANVDPKDVQWVEANSIQANTSLLKDGKGDIAFGYPATPFWLEMEAAPSGLAWMTLDPAADPAGAKRFTEKMQTGFQFGSMVAGAKSAIGVKSMTTIAPYVTTASTDAELVYNLVKWLDKNYASYKDGAPWTPFMTVDNLLVLAGQSWIPLHDGSVKYLKEIGKWNDNLEKSRQAKLAQLDKWVNGYQDAIKKAEAQGITVDGKNDAWVKFWENYKTTAGFTRFKAMAGL